MRFSVKGAERRWKTGETNAADVVIKGKGKCMYDE